MFLASELTRTYSSRMRTTTHLETVCTSVSIATNSVAPRLLGGIPNEQVLNRSPVITTRCHWQWGVPKSYAHRGTGDTISDLFPRGRGESPVQKSGGRVSLPYVIYPIMHLMLPTPCEQTDACENITFPQLLSFSVVNAPQFATLMNRNSESHICHPWCV